MDDRIMVGSVFNTIYYGGAISITTITTISCLHKAISWDLPNPIMATNMGGLPTSILLLILILILYIRKVPWDGDRDP